MIHLLRSAWDQVSDESTGLVIRAESDSAGAQVEILIRMSLLRQDTCLEHMCARMIRIKEAFASPVDLRARLSSLPLHHEARQAAVREDSGR